MTPWYSSLRSDISILVAPEVIELKGASTASDIWSLGCTVIELLTGKPPYADIHNGLSGMLCQHFTSSECTHASNSHVPHCRRRSASTS